MRSRPLGRPGRLGSCSTEDNVGSCRCKIDAAYTHSTIAPINVAAMQQELVQVLQPLCRGKVGKGGHCIVCNGTMLSSHQQALLDPRPSSCSTLD